ncbi:MAG: hypothetical protein ACETWM_03750 [Candidatus Lokiarchaeia archaeon]
MDPAKERKRIMLVVYIAVIFWIIGLAMLLTAFYLEFLGPYHLIPDWYSSKHLMTYKLGGIGLTLSGIFLSLIAIVRALTLMPQMLGFIITSQKK